MTLCVIALDLLRLKRGHVEKMCERRAGSLSGKFRQFEAMSADKLGSLGG
jgi:hypothetical protein